MHIIIPAAGRMRLKTSSSGICRTKRSRADSVSRFTRILVPKPKKAFQSPGTQRAGLKPLGTVDSTVGAIMTAILCTSERGCYFFGGRNSDSPQRRGGAEKRIATDEDRWTQMEENAE